MTPTNELRFVERWDTDEQTHDTRIIRVLQQKWHTDTYTVQEENCLKVMANVEWRDVPLVKEES